MKLLFDSFFKKITEKFLWNLGFNYQDRAIGLRVPDSPTGVLFNEQGDAHLFSGNNKVYLGLNKGISIESQSINLNGKQLNLIVTNTEDITINGASLNSELFNDEDYVLVPKRKLDGLFLVTSETVVVGNKLVNTTPLVDVLKSVKVLKSIENVEEPIEIKIARKEGIPIPSWLE